MIFSLHAPTTEKLAVNYREMIFFNKCLIVPNEANFIPELNTLDDHLKFATLDCIISL